MYFLTKNKTNNENKMNAINCCAVSFSCSPTLRMSSLWGGFQDLSLIALAVYRGVNDSGFFHFVG